MKKIVAIIRNPKEAENFVTYCANMASDLKASVDLYYFHSPEIYPMSSEGLTGATAQYLYVYDDQKELESEIKKIVNELIDKVKAKVSGSVSMRFVFKDGVFETLKDEVVKDEKNTLIAVEGREEDMFATRSTSNMDILAHADCPVWVVPEFASYKPLKKVVYATDYKEADVDTLRKIIQLTKKFNPRFVALHIGDSQDFQNKIQETGFEDHLKKETGYEKIEVKSVTKKSRRDTASTINLFAAENDAQLLVLLKENKSFLESVFKTSVTERLSQKTVVPALIYHEK